MIYRQKDSRLRSKARTLQTDAAESMSTLFSNALERLEQGEEWQFLHAHRTHYMPSSFQNFTGYAHVDADIVFPYPEHDETKWFVAKQLLDMEIRQISSRYSIEPVYKLKCMSEPRSWYFKGDTLHNHLPLEANRRKVYCPIVDLGIAPSVYSNSDQSHSIAVYPLINGPLLFDILSNLSFIRTIIELLQQASSENYEREGLFYDRVPLNVRPLYLFAFEIEYQLNKKHLMGDFINSLMLAKYPVLIVPDNHLSSSFDLLHLTRSIFDIKQVNVEKLFRNVMVISISQFIEIWNHMLCQYEIESLIAQNYLPERRTRGRG